VIPESLKSIPHLRPLFFRHPSWQVGGVSVQIQELLIFRRYNIDEKYLPGRCDGASAALDGVRSAIQIHDSMQNEEINGFFYKMNAIDRGAF
jgi:hypothetical protein